VDARVKVPSDLKQWVPLSTDVSAGQHVFVHLHEVIRENANKLYPGMRLTAPALFRLTRDAEVEIEEGADQGLRELVRQLGRGGGKGPLKKAPEQVGGSAGVGGVGHGDCRSMQPGSRGWLPGGYLTCAMHPRLHASARTLIACLPAVGPSCPCRSTTASRRPA